VQSVLQIANIKVNFRSFVCGRDPPENGNMQSKHVVIFITNY